MTMTSLANFIELYNKYDGTEQLWHRGKCPGAECPDPGWRKRVISVCVSGIPRRLGSHGIAHRSRVKYDRDAVLLKR